MVRRCRSSLNAEDHRQRIRNELRQVSGLLPLLMKRRNGKKWSSAERALLLRDLRTLSRLSPYLIPILLPGGIFMLPLVACWMDKRRNNRTQESASPLPGEK